MSQIDIELTYRLRGEADWRTVRLSPDDYFWRDPDHPDDLWEVDSPSQHTQSLGYLPGDVLDRVELVRHVAFNPRTKARQVRFYHVWAAGRSFSCHVRTLLPGEANREELIIVNALPFEQNCSETLRFDLATGEARLVMNRIDFGPGGDSQTIDALRE